MTVVTALPTALAFGSSSGSSSAVADVGGSAVTTLASPQVQGLSGWGQANIWQASAG